MSGTPEHDGPLRIAAGGYSARVVDPCHGMTGGAKVACSCGAWWVVGNQAWTRGQVFASFFDHLKRDHPK